MTISLYSISISLQSGGVTIFNGYFSVDNTTNLITAFYETVNGYINFNNNVLYGPANDPWPTPNNYFYKDTKTFTYDGPNIISVSLQNAFKTFTPYFNLYNDVSGFYVYKHNILDRKVISTINQITNLKTIQTIDPNITIRSLKVESTYQLNPISSSGQTYFLYKSSDDKIASIDRSGLIKAISPGKFNIQIYQPGTYLIEPSNYFLPWFITVN